MKKTFLIGRYIAALAVVAIVFQTGCTKEKGYINATPVDPKTPLTTYQYLKSKTGVYDSLLLVVDKLGIAKTLTDSTVTLFAPSNGSFRIAIENLNVVRKAAGLTPIYLSQLAAGDKPVTNPKLKAKAKQDSVMLDTLVSKYIIRKKFIASDFAAGDGQFLSAVRGGYPMHGQRVYADAQGYQNGGSEIIEFASTKRSLFVSNWDKTTTSSVNIQTKNGIVHLLKTDHVFGFNEFVSRLTFVPPPPSVFNLKTDAIRVEFVVASAYFDGEVSPGENLSKLTDGSVLTKFISKFDNVKGWNVKFYWTPKTAAGVNVGRIANCYTITSANDSKTQRGRDPRAFKIEGTDGDPTNTATVWTQLDIRQDQDWTTNYQQKTFDFPNTYPYKCYRLTIIQTGTGNTLDALFQISEWTMNYREQL